MKQHRDMDALAKRLLKDHIDLSTSSGPSSKLSTGSRVRQYLLLTLVALTAVGPFFWLASTALKGPAENIFASQPQWWPAQPTFDNLRQVWQTVHFGPYLANSAVVAVLTVVSNLLLSILAAYPLARMKLAGKGLFNGLVLLTMLIPFQVLMIPLYLLVLKLGLTQNHGPWAAWLGLALPFGISGFGIFFIRQAFVALPKELEEAALLDGANHWQRLWRVMVPLIQPSLATLAIFTLLASWGEFLWPSILLSDERLFTLPVGLVQLQGQFSANWRWIAAGTILSMVPVVLLFVLLQRWFLNSSLDGGVKG